MIVRIARRALWFRALRGLGWGFLCSEVFLLVLAALRRVGDGSLGNALLGVVSVLLVAAALVFPVQIIVMTALEAARARSAGWSRAVVVCGVGAPVLAMVLNTWFDFWGTAAGQVYLWTVTVVSMAASGFALLPVRVPRPGEDEAEVVLPLWRIPLALLAGLALGGFVYAALYYGWVVASLGDGSVVLFMIPQLFLASTIGCYAVVFMWRFSGQSGRGLDEPTASS